MVKLLDQVKEELKVGGKVRTPHDQSWHQDEDQIVLCVGEIAVAGAVDVVSFEDSEVVELKVTLQLWPLIDMSKKLKPKMAEMRTSTIWSQ